LRNQRPGWLFILIAILAALTLLLAACGGDDDDDDSADEEATATESAETEEEEEDEETEDAEATPEDEGDDESSDDDASTELDELVQDYESFTGHVTYDITELTSSDDTGLSSMSFYQKDGKQRVDIEDDTGTSTFITTEDDIYLCAEGQCIKYPADDPTADLGLGLFTGLLSAEAVADQFDIPDGVTLVKSSETIAGVDGDCYDAVGDLDPDQSGNETGKICFSEEGLLLSLDFEAAGESYSLIATEASTDVSDSDFEPPYDVVDLSELTQ
jgi:hypothetical protein